MVKGIVEVLLGFNGMMGEWVLSYDEDEVVWFQFGKYIIYYKGEKIVEEYMIYYQVCFDVCSSQGVLDMFCFVLVSVYDQICFVIFS